jgi:hypothetical protein
LAAGPWTGHPQVRRWRCAILSTGSLLPIIDVEISEPTEDPAHCGSCCVHPCACATINADIGIDADDSSPESDQVWSDRWGPARDKAIMAARLLAPAPSQAIVVIPNQHLLASIDRWKNGIPPRQLVEQLTKEVAGLEGDLAEEPFCCFGDVRENETSDELCKREIRETKESLSAARSQLVAAKAALHAHNRLPAVLRRDIEPLLNGDGSPNFREVIVRYERKILPSAYNAMAGLACLNITAKRDVWHDKTLIQCGGRIAELPNDTELNETPVRLITGRSISDSKLISASAT